MKRMKLASLALVAFFAVACSKAQQNEVTPQTKDESEVTKETTVATPQESPAEMKIGILTSTVSQSEDEYRAAQQIMQKYPGRVIHMTFPDNFMQEQETTVSNVVSMASDPKVKAIIVGQAIPGSIAAVRKVQRLRPDIVFIFWQPHEDPLQAAETADLLFNNDDVTRGRTIPQLAKKLGAKRLIHYSFPRHMSVKLLADRRDFMIKESEAIGIDFIFVTSPDPLAEGGIPAAQQFILEDVPRQIAKYGKDTAFFCTNDAMTEPLIKKVAELGAIFVEPDIPSPTMGFPGALGIEIPPEKAGDFGFINSQIKDAVAKLGNSGRMATWPVPSSIVTLKASADLLFETQADREKIKDISLIKKHMAHHAGVNVELTPYNQTTNFHLVLMEDIIY